MAANDHMHRSSLYVGDLHPEVTEQDLTETFRRAGPLLSVHLCRDKFSGKSLCYAYVNFWLPCHAFTALKWLNHTVLRGKSMRIMWYERNTIARKSGIGNLFVKNLDQSITSARLQSIFSKYGTILSCKVVEENGISKGFGFVQFDSEDSATAALGALHDTQLEGKKLYVSKFRTKIERMGAELGFRSLCAKNLRRDTTVNLTRDKFPDHGKVSSAVVIKDMMEKSSGFGFVSINAVQAFKKAMRAGEIGSKNLTVGRALRKDDYSYADHCIESKDSNLIVKNLDLSVDDKKLEKLFSGYGKVINAKVIRAGGVSSGIGFVRFSCPEDAKKALISLTGTDFEGRVLHVEVAQLKGQQTSKLYNSYEKFSPQPLYTSNNKKPCCNFPFTQPRLWLPTLYQHFVSPFNSSNLFQAQNFRGDFYALPMQLATLDESGRETHLEMPKGKITCSTLQGKITDGNGEEFCKGSGAVKTFFIRSSPEIYKIWPGYMHQPLIQKLQKGEKPSCRLQVKPINGDVEELCNGSDTMKTHCTGSSQEIDKNLEPGNAEVTPRSLEVHT